MTCFLGIFVMIMMVYHCTGWPWALAVVMLLGGVLALGINLLLQSWDKPPQAMATRELDKLQNNGD